MKTLQSELLPSEEPLHVESTAPESGTEMHRLITVAAFTGGREVPSARFRVRQYIPALRKKGIAIHEFISKFGAYPPKNRLMRPLWAAATVGARLPDIISSHQYHVTLLQREMLSTFATLEPLCKSPRVLDVDDAIFLYRGGKFAERLARNCDLVICGNEFLAENFGRWNRNIAVLPTGVDTKRYAPDPNERKLNFPIIGWIGTSGNFKYLYQIEGALSVVLRTWPRTVLSIVADCEPAFRLIPKDRVSFTRWAPDREVECLQRMTIGIMPLEDFAWERGKCSYKMLLYMACGLPVVVAPVGMNAQVLSQGDVGVAASSPEEWVDALLGLLRDADRLKRMGAEGRVVVQRHYSIDVVARQLAEHFRSVAI